MNDNWTFRCKCKKEIPYAAYAVAQITMGHDLVFTHRTDDGGCGATVELTRARMKKDQKRAESK